MWVISIQYNALRKMEHHKMCYEYANTRYRHSIAIIFVFIQISRSQFSPNCTDAVEIIIAVTKSSKADSHAYLKLNVFTNTN